METTMKKLVITLERREDRRKHFLSSNANLKDYTWLKAVDGADVNMELLRSMNSSTALMWRDPFLNRKLTQGEVGCLLSHMIAWKRCVELDEPVLILEDDAIIGESYDEEYYQSLVGEGGYDLVYLQRNENLPADVVSIDEKLEIPAYPYNTTAYIITPKCAKTLVNTDILQKIIPVDEYLPLMKEHLKIAALKEDSVKQAPRNLLSSDIEGEDYFIDFKTHPITVGTDNSKCASLNTTAALKGVYPLNLGLGVEWEGGDMSGIGGGHKVDILRSYIDTLPDHDVVLFTDAYDVLYNDDIESITRKYLSYRAKVVFAGEESCWPDSSTGDAFTEIAKEMGHEGTKVPFLNSGVFIGQVSELKKMLSDTEFHVENSGDDQLFYQNIFLSRKYDIKLDYECRLFQCDSEDVIIAKDGSLLQTATGNTGSIYHGNGGEESKRRYKKKENKLIARSPMLYIPQYGSVEIIEKDMLVIDYMTQMQCDDLIALSEKHGDWGPMAGDKFPAQEIRLKELGHWDAMTSHWEKNIYPIICKYWHPMDMYGMRDAFVMRYSAETQKSLNLHTDASLVTGSVKLNDNYEGADLVFPRQNISNKSIPVGRAILFPGQVTHGHECTELTKGVKYSLTMWSSRFGGDTL